MKLGTATSVLYLHPIHDAIAIIAKSGFDGVDLWGGRPHIYRQDFSQKELANLRQCIHDHGLSVSSFMPAFYRYPHSLSNPNPKVREDSLDYMRQCIDNAAILGAKIVLVVPDHSLFGEKREDSRQRLAESIDKVARYAYQYDLRLGIEVLYYDETDLVNTCEDAIQIIRQLGHENIGVVLDTGTLNLSKESPSEFLPKLGDRLLQIHVNDNAGHEKQQNLIPGEGSYDFKSLIEILKEYKYCGFLSAELTKEYAIDPEPALRLTVERMRSWMEGGK